MRHSLPLLLSLAATLPFAVKGACGQEATYIVSYIEVAPASRGEAVTLLRQLGETSRNYEGSLRFEVLQRVDRTHHFALLEAWKDAKAHEAHAAAAHVKQFRDKLRPLLAAPYDERPHGGLAVGPMQARADGGRSAIHVVTHVDVIPPKKDDGIAALKAMVEPSRKEPGNGRLDVLQQSSRPNHLTVVEIWADQKALDAHATAPHVKQFREQIGPMSGSLYDERLYRALD